ncbi:MAG: hypothetical protein R6T99_00150 [Bacteroidales bacterium]
MIALLLASLFAKGQEFGNFREKQLEAVSDTLHPDTLSLVPGSVSITDSSQRNLTNHYAIDHAASLLMLKKEYRDSLYSGPLIIRYRTLPYDLSKEFHNKDASWLSVKTEEPVNPFVYKTDKNQGSILDFDNLNKSGSISRGISFGNNQDMVVNSNFNLQLSGKLSREIDVVAAITDNNIPIQPEGNTQQLQEFDKVFIKLSARNNELTVGDYDLASPGSHFMNFFKKAQGAEFKSRFDIMNKKRTYTRGHMKVRGAAALSRGKFARNKFNGNEGNQGPYKLEGNEGETFIIILAGSEKVYIDGRLLRRGESKDYTINYNTGEITFTPNILITKDKRIVAEFEYSDKSYARAMFFVNNEYKNKNLHIRINGFSESDLKNQSLDQELTAGQKEILRKAGDSTGDAFVYNIDSTGFAGDEVRYMLVDTLVNGILYDSVLVHSDNPGKAIYKAGFSNVGAGKGNYVLVKSDANGRVFEWKAPVNGVLQGSHEPVQLLVPPRKKQMLTTSMELQLPGNAQVLTEFAVSNHDVNTFSDKDKGDNTGFALRTLLDKTWRLGRSDTTWTLNTGIFYEWTGHRFQYIEPYRPVEFERDWNVEDNGKETENHAGLHAHLRHPQKGSLKYELLTLLRSNGYKGLKNDISGGVKAGKMNVDFSGSYLNTSNRKLTSDFLRHRIDISRRVKKIRIGLRDDQEYNILHRKETDSITLNSYSYFEWGGYIANADSGHTNYEIFYNQRYDKAPRNNQLRNSTKAEELGFKADFEKNRNNRLNISGTYRSLHVYDSLTAAREPENTLIGRIEHFLRIGKGILTMNTYYEIGSGLEEKQEFSYLKVPTGEGIYTWIDYNGDNIQQLNEFEIAPFRDEANYIRIYSQSNDYIKAYYNQFSESILLNPATVWSVEEGIKKFISRFSNQLSFHISHKTSENDPAKAYNPFINERSLNDSLLLSLSSSFRNTLYYNRNNPTFGADLSIQSNRNKNLLVNGFETRDIQMQKINLRWNFFKGFSMILGGETGNRKSFSQFFSARNYHIKYYRIEPTLSYQPGPELKIDINYVHTNKENVQDHSGVKAIVHEAGIALSYKIVNRGSLQAGANYINVHYNDKMGTPLAFEMLDGFQPGRNGTWNLVFQQNISGHLQVSLQYNGRKSPEIQTVHLGSIQLRAYF